MPYISLSHRYRTEPDEELAERGMPDFGIGQYEDYKALNFDKCLAELRTVADWDGANRLIIMREEVCVVPAVSVELLGGARGGGGLCSR